MEGQKVEKRRRAPGGGRKALPPDERLVQTSIRLSRNQIEQLRAMGDGNLSAGIRKALELAKGMEE